MKKLAAIIAGTLILGTTLAKADDFFEPGSYENPYVIEKDFLLDEYEIRPKYPTGGDEDFEPGGYYNPYIIEKDPLLNEYEIRPKYYFDDDENW